MSSSWAKFLRGLGALVLPWRDRLGWRWAPWLILSVAILLRLYGLDWDQGKLFHPDERALLMKVDEIYFPMPSQLGLLLDVDQSPLNPRWFPYGTFPMYLLEIVQTAFSPLIHLDTYGLRIPGRLLSAAADVGTVMAVLALGIRLYSRRVAMLASAFIALAVIHVQLAHFFAVDTFLAFFTVATMLFLGKVAHTGGLKYSALAGLCLGLALATKVSIAFLVLPFLLAHVMALFAVPERQSYLPLYARLRAVLFGTIVGGAVALIALFAAMPYAFLDWSRFLLDVVEQSEIIRRVRYVPYTLQYVDTMPFIYHMKNLGLWGLGIPLGITVGIGFVFTVIHFVLRPNKADLLILSLVIPYLLFFGSLETKFLRYMLPVTPFLVLLGSRMLFWAWDISEGLRRFHGRQIVSTIIASIVVMTALYSLAFASIYTRPHSAVEASHWMNENVPSGAIILREHWEESLRDMGEYVDVELPMYDPDTDEKVKLLSEELARADYLVFYSHRLYGAISRLPHRYPWSRAYYHALFSGDLGYVLRRSFTSYPSLAGISLIDETFDRAGLVKPTRRDSQQTGFIGINLGYADESFTVYDHPKVLVFQRVVDKAPEEIRQHILDYEISLRDDSEKQPMMMTLDEAQVQSSGGTWADIMRPYSWPSRYPVLAWLLMVEFISLLTLPLSMVLFRSLPDRGFVLAKGLGLLLVAYVPWLLASLHWMSFSRASILLTLVLLGSVSGLVLVLTRGRELVHFLKCRWSLLLVAEAVFLVAFAAFLAIRMAHPDIAHPWVGSTWLAGEKHMDLAYLTATVKSTFMPPYDPWYAGGYLNYYYFGMVPLAVLIKSTGIAPGLAYNLAIPLLFALTVSLAFSLVYNLTELMRRMGSGRTFGPVMAGILAGVFVGVLGNLDGLVQLLQGTVMVLFGNGPFPDFDYWRSARMMPPQISITEFPFWTFLYADLHAHMESMPFTLLSLGIGLALIAGARANERWPISAGVLVLLALAVGSLAATNTWDYPTYLLIAVAVIPLTVIARRHHFDGRAIREILSKSVCLIGLSYILFLPFHLRYVNAYTGVLWSKWQTPLYQYIGIHGLFLFLVITLVVMEVLRWQKRDWSGLSPHSWFNSAKVWGPGLVVSGLGFGVFLAIGYHTVAFLGILLAAMLALVVLGFKKWGDEAPYILFVLILVAVAVLLGIGVDLFTVRGDVDRMNTVFKFYIQAWILFAVTSAFVLWRVRVFFFSRPWKSPGKVIWLSFLCLLLVASSIYPILGTKALLGDRYTLLPLTLDGTAYMRAEGAFYPDPKGPITFEWDYMAITWLQENVSGSPVIVEAVTPLYRWGSRVSVYTGLPTVVGWPWHQMQQRWDARHEVEARVSDVEEMFTTADLSRTTELLEKYRVSYIYFGEQERLYYPSADMTKFDRMVGHGLELVYENPGVRIYWVKG